MVCDIMVAKNVRGQGVFTRLGNYSIENLHEEGLNFITGNPIRPEVIPGHKKSGWEDPFILPMYGKFLSIKSFFISKRFKKIFLFFDFILRLWNWVLMLNKNLTEDIEVEYYNNTQIDSIKGLELFFNKLNSEIPNYLIKNISFLKWRFGAPKSNYSIVVLRKDKNIIAYSITTFMEKEGVPCMGVLDFAMLSGFEKYSSILLEKNEIIAKKGNAELILIMIGKNWAKKFKFFVNGYIKTPYNFTFIFKILNNFTDSDQLKCELNWHLMWIDFDNL